jgi:hypothetical protein
MQANCKIDQDGTSLINVIKILADMDSGVVFAVASGLAVGIAFIAVFSLNFPVIEGEELQSNTVQKLDLSFVKNHAI